MNEKREQVYLRLLFVTPFRLERISFFSGQEFGIFVSFLSVSVAIFFTADIYAEYVQFRKEKEYAKVLKHLSVLSLCGTEHSEADESLPNYRTWNLMLSRYSRAPQNP